MTMPKQRTTEVNDIKSCPEARGKRLKRIRMLAGLSRKMVETKYQISASTLQSWEDGKAGGLTEKGAKRIMHSLREEGLQFSIEWLLHGIGSGPQISDRIYTNISPSLAEEECNLPMGEESALVKELLAFRQCNKDAIDIVVNDDGMEPYFSIGDYIGGKRRFDKDIISAIGLDCIVETSLGEHFLRRLRHGSTEGVYTLTCLNPNTSLDKPTLYDVQLISAAPVIWQRRRDPK
jgi:DNA-binding transcriptional regulator YiaG